ncbi:hypothetical protein C9374_003577 [Naegleria lovaniensis]|uniref:Uncharacterized protein n=1 Tax=Naegleria lovaniensis TaxID=51637 RepID=A0AA88GZC9_NAELO|nr:uncharacterized protein C9374_003577 [Naegleria lovaniensis]KAG2393813.1 hypothetical protein C9374_003577 [Naegleria lovaniensis]
MPHQFTPSSTSSSPFSSNNNNTTTKNSSKLFSSTVRFFSHHLKLTRKSWLVILVVHFILMSLLIFYFRRHPRSSNSNLDQQQQQDSHSEQNSLLRSLLKFQTTTTTTDNHHHIMEDTDGVIHAFDPSHQRLELVRRNLFSRLNLSLEDHLATLEYMECSKLTFAERWYDPIVLSNPNMVQDRVENDSMLEFPNSTPLHVPYYLTRQHVHLFQPYTYPTPDKTEAKFAFKRRVRGFYNFIPVHVVKEEEEEGKGHQILSNGTIESNSEKNAHNHSTTRETSFSERTTTTAETNKPQVEKQHLENSFNNASETSSTTYIQIKETEFRNYFFTHRDKFRRASQLQVNDTTLLDWRDEMNNLNLVLNSEKFDMSLFGNHNEHLPIWLRCYKRTFPLSETLKAVCRVHDIQKSILYVTIDGNEFDEILELVTTVTCVKMHIYFHNFERNLRNLLGPRFDPSFLDLKIPKMSTHAIWGLHLLFVKFNYLYVITLEDDLKPLPDFYNYHRSMYHLTLDPSPSNIYIAVSSHAHSMAHHCRFINSTLVSEQLIPYEDSFDEYMYEKIISYGHNLNDNEGDLELAPFMIGSRRELPVFEIENFLNDVDATTTTTTTTSTTSTMSELKPDEEIAPVGSVHDPVTRTYLLAPYTLHFSAVCNGR